MCATFLVQPNGVIVRSYLLYHMGSFPTHVALIFLSGHRRHIYRNTELTAPDLLNDIPERGGDVMWSNRIDLSMKCKGY